MTRAELIAAIADAISHQEGFWVTEAEAKSRKISFPTPAQRNANPGNIRKWYDRSGNLYPTHNGYIDFVQWSSDHFPGATHEDIAREALDEGWRILRLLVSQYIDGHYTSGKLPTLDEMFAVYAPSADGNRPKAYAQFVAQKVGIPTDKVLAQIA